LNTLRVVFAGTPEFSVPSLRVLIKRSDIEIARVYTRPDGKKGRGLKLVPSPVKRLAKSVNLPISEVSSLRDGKEIDEFKKLKPDLLVVVAFGLVLPQTIIEIPKLAINVHASLLPRWRGAAPIQRCIAEGDLETGISIMRIVEELDAGPVLLQKSCPISQKDTSGSLHARLASLGGTTLDSALDQIFHGNLSETPQDESKVTYASKIISEEVTINWNMSASSIDHKIRSLHPKPGALATISGIELKIISATVVMKEVKYPAGEVLIEDKNKLLVATGHGYLQIQELQVPGKKVSKATTFINGYGKFL
jgi:methionyl-tRNA formyltransferase